MKVCFLIPSMAGGGAERVIANLANEMVRNKIEVTIIMTSGEDVEYDLDKDVKLLQIGTVTRGSCRLIINRLLSIRSYIKKNRDTHYIGMETMTNLYLLISSIGIGADIIVSERNDPRKFDNSKYRDLIYYLFGKKIVFQTRDARNCFSWIKEKNTRIIYNPVKVEYEHDVDTEIPFSLVAVGRLDPQKDYETLLKAFAIVRKNLPGATLDIFGRGESELEIKALISEHRLSDDCRLNGFSRDVWREAVNKSVYVLSSEYEGMPNALIEAMAIGIPVISTDCPIGGPREMIQDGVNGMLVEVGDYRSLADSIYTLLTDKKMRESFSYESKKKAEELNVNRICEQWLEFIKQ